MISPVSYNPFSSTYNPYSALLANRTQAADKAQSAQRPDAALLPRKAQPDTPVQPVTAPRAAEAVGEDPAKAGLLRFSSDPAEMAVRMRIQYPDEGGQVQDHGADQMKLSGAQAQDHGADQTKLHGPVSKGSTAPGGVAQDHGADTVAFPSGKQSANGVANPSGPDSAVNESKSAQEVMEEGECETCKDRKYQDGSDDPGVSFKTPTNIAPEQAASAVRGHENEHVVREQAKARQENRKVVSQSVSYHSDICPECGKVYVSGGTTRTVTKADNSEQMDQRSQQQDPARPFNAIA